MSRSPLNIKYREVFDYRYNDSLIGKFINMLTLDGKKSIAEKIVYGALDNLEAKFLEKNYTILTGFRYLVEVISPDARLVTKKVGGTNYQVPVPLSSKKKLSMGLKNLKITFVKSHGKTAEEKLTNEMLSILEGKGNAIKKKEDDDKAVEAKRAYAHLA